VSLKSPCAALKPRFGVLQVGNSAARLAGLKCAPWSHSLLLTLEYPQDRVAINGNLNADNQKHLEELGRSIEASSSSKAVYRKGRKPEGRAAVAE